MDNVKYMILGLTINSIRASAVSLLGQLNEYEWLNVTEEQEKKLGEIEKQFHDLVKEITEPKQGNQNVT